MMPSNCSTTWHMPQPVKAVCLLSTATAVCGSGRLDASATWVAVAGEAHTAYSHTGHAVYLHSDGSVLGTGGNLAGPLGRLGYGDKAVRWGVIFEGVSAVATGSRHTLAMRPDGSLQSWGQPTDWSPVRC